MSVNEQLQSQDQEVSLIKIVLFLRESWKVIALFWLLGIVGALIFLWVTPSRYAATTLIQMAKVSTSQNPLGVNAEEPAALIARMSSPTSLDAAVISACGLKQAPSVGDSSINTIKLTSPKGLSSVVELKVIQGSGELAKVCAQSVFDQISASQALLANPAKRASKARLAIVNERLEQDKQLLTKIDISKNATSMTYFSLLNEKRSLEDEREKLESILSNGDLIATQMQYPIEVSAKPIYPKKSLSLFLGMFGGLLSGLLIALGQQIIGRIGLEFTRKQSNRV